MAEKFFTGKKLAAAALAVSVVIAVFILMKTCARNTPADQPIESHDTTDASSVPATAKTAQKASVKQDWAEAVPAAAEPKTEKIPAVQTEKTKSEEKKDKFHNPVSDIPSL